MSLIKLISELDHQIAAEQKLEDKKKTSIKHVPNRSQV